MFRFKLCVLTVFAFAAYASAEYVDYCDCLKDVEVYKKKYEELYDGYYGEAGEELKNAYQEIEKRIEGLKTNNPCEMPTNADDYIQDMMTLCGGNRLAGNYAPSWRKHEKSDQATCQFLSVKLPALLAQKGTMNDIVKNCDYMGEFDKSIKTVIDKCGVCKSK